MTSKEFCSEAIYRCINWAINFSLSNATFQNYTYRSSWMCIYEIPVKILGIISFEFDADLIWIIRVLIVNSYKPSNNLILHTAVAIKHT